MQVYVILNPNDEPDNVTFLRPHRRGRSEIWDVIKISSSSFVKESLNSQLFTSVFEFDIRLILGAGRGVE